MARRTLRSRAVTTDHIHIFHANADELADAQAHIDATRTHHTIPEVVAIQRTITAYCQAVVDAWFDDAIRAA